MQVIVVEGGDGVGKSTLVRRLAERYGFTPVHMSIPDPVDKPFQYWLGRIVPLLKTNPKGLIVDRLHWSEDVYGTLRGGSQLSAHERWLLEGWLFAHDALMVRCVVPKGVAWANVLKKPAALHHDSKTFEQVYEGYERPWMTRVPVVCFDYTIDYNDSLGFLDAFVTRPNGGLPATHQGIGSCAPFAVLVGDRHGTCDNPCEKPVVFDKTGDRDSASGGYLREALACAQLTLREVHVTNGWHGSKDDEVLLRLPEQLRSRRTVALGAEAERSLRAQGISDFTRVPHPQYWRRFNHARIDEYVNALREAVGLAPVA